MKLPRPAPRHRLLLATAAVLLGACATIAPPEPTGAPAREAIVAVTVSNQILLFNAGQPQQVSEKRALTGLAAGERLLGIDYRVARGELYALGASGQLYKIDVGAARATPIGTPAALPAASSPEWSFDFNPTVDRIRVVNSAGWNLRLHPDTGAVVDTDPNTPGLQFNGRLAYDVGDINAGKPANVVGAGYSYNKLNNHITTNYTLDGAMGLLLHQGTKEGVAPMVSPNTGRLYSVGSLGIGPFAHATFDISDITPTAYAGVRAAGAKATRWHRVDLAMGRASFIGTVGGGGALAGAAIEP
ncbi:MAG: hypothetical protein C0505_11305 [Leptothrix sp. (in: Bacteria)]|nr:hypothetical protein [Leptothrix sp. (in: b-proteobacteria)]